MADPALTIVICFDHAAITGGQAMVAFDSAVGLKEAGHRPIIFAAAGPVSPRLSEAGIETVCLDQKDLIGNPSKLAAAAQGIWNKKAADRLGTLLADLPRDRTVVHVHGWAKALSPSIAGPIRASGLPAVYTMHEYFQFCPNGGFYNYQRNEICRLKPLSAACWATHCDSRTYPRKLWRNVRLSAAKHVAHLPDVFQDYIAISDFQEDIIRPLVPPTARLHRIDNPIAVPNLGRKTSPATGEAIFVGRLSPEKGVFVFAEAARRIGSRPIFIGDGPLAGELKQRYPESVISGWQDATGVRTAMRAARALVFPSLWYEGQPLTVLEAKALGVPVVVSDACAGREEVEHGRTGLWFRSGDPDDLALALTTLWDDQFVIALSHAAFDAFWRDPPTLERHVKRTAALYISMLGDKGQAPSFAREPANANPASVQAA